MWRKKRGGKSVNLGQCLGVFVGSILLFTGSVFNVFAQGQGLMGQNKVQTIELFVESGTGIVRLDERVYQNVKWSVHVVDEADQIKASLNELIKNIKNEAEARELVQPYFKDPEFVARLKRAHLAKLQAERYRLKTYPSAVINRGEGLVSGYVDMNLIVDLVNQKGVK